MTKLPIILILSLLFPLCSFAHGDKVPLSFSGIVSDKELGTGLEGATISIEKNGQVIHSTQTDSEGNFCIKMESPLTRRDQIRLTVEKQGFKSSIYLPVNQQNINLELELEPRIPMPIIKSIGGPEPVFAI